MESYATDGNCSSNRRNRLEFDRFDELEALRLTAWFCLEHDIRPLDLVRIVHGVITDLLTAEKRRLAGPDAELADRVCKLLNLDGER